MADPKIIAALKSYDEGMAHIGSCGDGNCLIVRPKGQHTNGGCRCSTDKYKAQRAMQRGRMLADAVRASLMDEEKQPLFTIRDKTGEEPCGECHLQPGDTCDICGAYAAAEPA